MKVFYDPTTDFMSIILERCASTYVEDGTCNFEVVKNEENDEIVGYHLYNSSQSLILFDEITAAQKLAALIKMHRKMLGISQVELHLATSISLPTIKLIERGEVVTSFQNLIKIKQVLMEIDLNSLSRSKVS